MPRHVPDDFSFLPTVDSTDEEIMEKAVSKKPAPFLPPVAVPQADPEEAETTWSPEEVPTTVIPPETVAYEPEPPQDGRAMWEDFLREGAPEAPVEGVPDEFDSPASPLPKTAVMKVAAKETQPPKVELKERRQREVPAELPHADTPPVSLGGKPKLEKTAAKNAKAEPHGKPQEVPLTEALPSADSPDPKPFIAPKPAPEEPLDPETAKKRRWQKLVEKVGIRSLGWSVGVHLFLLLVGAFVGLNQVMDRQVDFLPGGGSAQSQAASAELTHKMQQKKNPWLKAKPQMQKITVQSIASDIVLPEMPMDMLDMSNITSRMDISKASGSLGLGGQVGMGTAGAGGGFGAGIGAGGKFSFVGQTALGRRVVFVVDVSGSMSAVGSGESISRFDLLKKELIKAINQMPMNTQYQILYFSDFAWPHDQVDSRSADALAKYRWEIDSKDYKKAKIPTFRFIQATPFSLRDTADIIQRSDNPGGTNWGSGLLMALNANPKPDVIFFMTDGLRSDEQGWVDVVTAENKRRLPLTAIYTSAMQQPDAARELDDLARRNGGRFTVVLGDGKIVKGEDYFKMKR